MKLASALEGTVQVTDLNAGALDLKLASPSFRPLLLGLDFEEGDAIERLDDMQLEVKVPPNAAAVGYPVHLTSTGGHLAGFDYQNLETRLTYRSPKVDIQSG
jgi:hypothetical protein